MSPAVKASRQNLLDSHTTIKRRIGTLVMAMPGRHEALEMSALLTHASSLLSHTEVMSEQVVQDYAMAMRALEVLATKLVPNSNLAEAAHKLSKKATEFMRSLIACES